jgi:hypothetical protein
MDGREFLKDFCQHLWKGWDFRSTHELPVVMGGAPRNVMTGLEINDIDLFSHTDKALTHVSQKLDCGPFLQLGEEQMKEYGVGDELFPPADSHKFKVYRNQCVSFSGWVGQIDFVVCAMPAIEQIKEFPDMLSQHWCVMNTGVMSQVGELRRTEAARRDHTNQSVSYYGSKMQPPRLTKLREYYPDWTFIDLDGGAGYKGTPLARRGREPDHAPFYWDMKPPRPEAAMDVTRVLCGGKARE